jgi:hypothetical protein
METVHVLASPDVKEKLQYAGIEVIGSSPEELLTQMKTDTVVAGEGDQGGGIRLD